MRWITEEQDAIGWTNLTEGRVTKRIRGMQTMYLHMQPRCDVHGGPLDERLCAEIDGAVPRELAEKESDEAS